MNHREVFLRHKLISICGLLFLSIVLLLSSNSLVYAEIVQDDRFIASFYGAFASWVGENYVATLFYEPILHLEYVWVDMEHLADVMCQPYGQLCR